MSIWTTPVERRLGRRLRWIVAGVAAAFSFDVSFISASSAALLRRSGIVMVVVSDPATPPPPLLFLIRESSKENLFLLLSLIQSLQDGLRSNSDLAVSAGGASTTSAGAVSFCFFLASCSADLTSSSVTPCVDRLVSRTRLACAFRCVSDSSSRTGGTKDLKKFLIIVPGLSFTLVSEDVPDGEVVQVVVGITIRLRTGWFEEIC